MATFVLVHGGWDGAWQWEHVVPRLRALEHVVYPITLTGLGERWHLVSPEVDLHTHVEDVVNTILFERLTGVVLVGHSYGGAVITGVAEQAPDRLRHLIYLDAVVPFDGQTVLQCFGPEIEAWFREQAAAHDGWRIPFDPPDGPDTHRRTPHPLATLDTPVAINHPDARSIPRTYVYCTDKAAMGALNDGLQRAAERAQRDPHWRYRELPTGHTPMQSMPEAVVDLLAEVVS
jgi:pimeloyl-ACP methyl ester carboxylesterase